MHRFAALYRRLDDTRSTAAKVAAMADYFRAAPPADAAWALHFLRGGRLKRLIAPTALRAWIGTATGFSPVIVEACYAQVGDLAETLALLLDRSDKTPPPADAPQGLADWVRWLDALRGAAPAEQEAALVAVWRWLPLEDCFLLNKLLTGGLRVGVSAGLAARAVAVVAALPDALLHQRLAGDWQPSASAYLALLAPPAADDARLPSQPYPFCLASPLDDAPDDVWADGLPSGLGPVGDWLAEWKWDGIRGQLIRRAGQTFLWSRGEERLDGRFPELEAAAVALPDGTVLDGEILAHDGTAVLPFAVLQTRIARKTVGPKLLAQAPVAFLAYDLLEAGGDDWRPRPLAERRARLAALIAATGQSRLRLSEAIAAEDWPTLAAARAESRDRGVEGLMLKRLDSSYGAGRKRGAWWKWKLAPMSFDAVLVYAQAGHGRRANLYTDYTLAVWEGPEPGEGALLPVAKAYSGLTDAELTAMDTWIKRNTRERFGPVRSVEASAEHGQVFEIAFEGIQPSPRHKAGIALRFPRIARWRRDKPTREANTLEDLKRLLRPA